MKRLIQRIQFCSVIVMVLFLAGIWPAHAVTVKLSGQISRAVMYLDNGQSSDIYHVDNDNSSTRFRLTGEEELENNFKVGVVWETEFESNSSSGVDVGQDDDGDADFKERKLEAWFGCNYGKLWIGQGDGAANGTSEVDLSGTSVAMYSDMFVTANSVTFRTTAGATGPKVGDTRNNFDGLSRNDRLRYDTPVIGGFYFSTSATNGDAWEVAARWAREFDGIGKFATALGYVDTSSRTIPGPGPGYEQIGISGSWLHISGFNITAAWGERDHNSSSVFPTQSNRDSKNYYIKLGYTWGMHALAVDYGQTEDLAMEGDESENWGVAYVLNPWNGVEFYGMYRLYSLERTAMDYDDIDQVMVGARIKF